MTRRAPLLLLIAALALAPGFAATGWAATGWRDPVVDLESWNIQPVLAGLPVKPLIGKPAIDAQNRQVGTVADVLFSARGYAAALIVRTPDGVAAYDWRRIGVPAGAQSVRIAGAAGPDRIALPPRAPSPAPRPFFATELIGDHVQLDNKNSFGFVVDTVLGADGRLLALSVRVLKGPGLRSPIGIFPFPFYGYQIAGFDPAFARYELPYNGERVYRYLTRYPLLDTPGHDVPVPPRS